MKDVSEEGKAQNRQEATRAARLFEYYRRTAEKIAEKEEAQNVKA